NITVNARFNGIGRHLITNQGSINFTYGGTARDIVRLGCDNEATSLVARIINASHKNCHMAPGTDVWHMAPAVVYGEPPRYLQLTLTAGSSFVTCPAESFIADDLGGLLTGTGIPDETVAMRRMSPTVIEMSAEATASGTITAVLGPATMCHNWEWDHVGVSQDTVSIVGNLPCPHSKVYFTGTTEVGSAVISDVQFDDRIDGLTFTTDDVGGALVDQLEPNLFTGPPVPPDSVTSTTITLPYLMKKTTGTDQTYTVTTTNGSRKVTRPSGKWVNADIKGKRITATGIPTDALVLRVTDAGKSVVLNRPCTADGTVTAVESARSRFFATLGPAEWYGMRVNEVRNVGTGKWAGQSDAWAGKLGTPAILAPAEQDGIEFTKNFLVGARAN